MNSTRTICALATAASPSGVAIIRISGTQTRRVVESCYRGPSPLEKPRTLISGEIVDPQTGSRLDHCLLVFFAGPASFTGEDSAEIHCHGSPLIVRNILRTLLANGAEAARPGEFTERAFLNGKLDLVQAEALADVIAAGSEQALQLAQEQLKGRFSEALTRLGEPLRDILAEIEASIDFPEEDIAPDSLSELGRKVGTVRAELQRLVGSYNFGQVLKEGFRVLLCGKPNAGKSSLLNALLGKRRALVSPIPGTTRDVLEEAAEIEGFRFLFCDSAGIRADTHDLVENMGIELAVERMRWADLILVVADISDADPAGEVLERLEGIQTARWLLLNKIDLHPQAPVAAHKNFAKTLPLSATTQSGLEELMKALAQELRSRRAQNSENTLVLTNERQRACLEKALAATERCADGMQTGAALELIAADTRSALGALEEVVGATYTEDILGRIFSKFCIGK